MTMKPELTRELIRIEFLVDTNCVNARQRMPAMNQLEQWAASDLIQLVTAQTAQKEMVAGGNSDRIRKAYRFIYTISAITTSEEQRTLDSIATALFPGVVPSQSQRNDIEIVFNASKYGNTLITNDGGSRTQPGGILGNRHKLSALGINVFTPEEAELHVRAAINARDEHAREWSQYTGQALAPWVGQD